MNQNAEEAVRGAVAEALGDIRVVQLLRGKEHGLMGPNFLVVHDHLLAKDGTVYVAGYIKAHFPNGAPVDKLTLRRISLKKGEEKRLLKTKGAKG